MTQEQKRIKIAEACGYDPTKTPAGICWYNPNASICNDGHVLWDVEELPDYFDDRNAITEAIAGLPEDKQAAFGRLLGKATDVLDDDECARWYPEYAFALVTAPIEVLAEAYGQTLRLW